MPHISQTPATALVGLETAHRLVSGEVYLRPC